MEVFQRNLAIVRVSSFAWSHVSAFRMKADVDAIDRLWDLAELAREQGLRFFLSGAIPLEGVPLGPIVGRLCHACGPVGLDETCANCGVDLKTCSPRVHEAFPDPTWEPPEPNCQERVVVVFFRRLDVQHVLSVQAFLRRHTTDEVLLKGALKGARESGHVVEVVSVAERKLPATVRLLRVCAGCQTTTEGQFCTACGQDLRQACPFIGDPNRRERWTTTGSYPLPVLPDEARALAAAPRRLPTPKPAALFVPSDFKPRKPTSG